MAAVRQDLLRKLAREDAKALFLARDVRFFSLEPESCENERLGVGEVVAEEMPLKALCKPARLPGEAFADGLVQVRASERALVSSRSSIEVG